MFEFVHQLSQLINQTIMVPFLIAYNLLWYIYKIIFFIQIYMCSSCRSIFGDGFGCDILDPNYVFTTVVLNTIQLIIIVRIGIKLWSAWIKWNDTNEKKND